MLPSDEFNRLIRMAHCQGWYVTRQHMIKRGFSLEAVASVLIAVIWEGV